MATLITEAEPTVTFQCRDSLCRILRWWQSSLLAQERYLLRAVVQWNRIRSLAAASVRQAPKRIITAPQCHRMASSRWNSIIRVISAKRTQDSRGRATSAISNLKCYRLEILVWTRAIKLHAWWTHTTIWPWVRLVLERSQVLRWLTPCSTHTSTRNPQAISSFQSTIRPSSTHLLLSENRFA